MTVSPTSVSCVTAAEAPWLDEQLLVGLRAGSPASFAQLYRERAASIYNLCLRILRSPQDAQDVTHEVFIRAFRQLPGCGEDFQLKAWLYRVAVNACYDLLRSRKAHPVSADAPDEIGPARIDAFEQAELARALEQTLARLSANHRTVLVLKDMHGLSHEEIAAALGMSRGATETLLFRARAAFRSTYLTIIAGQPAKRCDLARRAAVASVGGGLSELERRRIADHARFCPDCRKTVETWGLAVLGLGAFLHAVPLPAALAAPPLAAAGGAGAVGSVVVTAAASTGGAAAGAATASGSAAGVAVASGTAAGAAAPAATALTVGAAVKASMLAIAASGLLIAGGVTVHHFATQGGHAPSAGVPVSSVTAGRQGHARGSVGTTLRKRGSAVQYRRERALRVMAAARARAAARAARRAQAEALRATKAGLVLRRAPTRSPRPQPRPRPSVSP